MLIPQKSKNFTIQLFNETRLFFFSKKYVIVSGPRGKILYKKNLGNYIFVLKKYSLSFYQYFSVNNKTPEAFKLYSLLQSLIYGVHFFFSKKLFFIGVGVKIWLKILQNNTKVLLIKIGYSQDLCVSVPNTIILFPLKYNMLLVRGLNKNTVTQFTNFIRSLKKPDVYKGKGIQYQDEILVLKTGKKN